ncbi:MAG: hypothetical protein ABI680_08555 [Chthoniobacteraceae bacterium]
MCNRFVQKGREVRPQENATVLMNGPGGFFELPFEAVFGVPARNESRNYWIKHDGAEPVIVLDIERFGEKDKTTRSAEFFARHDREKRDRPVEFASPKSRRLAVSFGMEELFDSSANEQHYHLPV